ncbi:MAG: S-adenosylmethionine:tRNA ribosyltransferase-isomerase, partial [Eubacterium sp.]|nr:S-adenosylmethionine:tRNA ribosyltransferase-isomerase [Eubacterium sp.]
MKKSDFYYDLPKERIAQTPIEPRDASRMLVIDRKTDVIEDKHFYDIVNYLEAGDCLILNDTKVLPARLYGIKEDTGAHVEFLMLTQKENDVWEVITGPGRRAKQGTRFAFGDGILKAEIIDVLDNGNRLAKFSYEGNN